MANREALKAHAEPSDWPEDFPHENGIYNCICCFCQGEFTGHKRRVCCKTCDTVIPEIKNQPYVSREIFNN